MTLREAKNVLRRAGYRVLREVSIVRYDRSRGTIENADYAIEKLSNAEDDLDFDDTSIVFLEDYSGNQQVVDTIAGTGIGYYAIVSLATAVKLTKKAKSWLLITRWSPNKWEYSSSDDDGSHMTSDVDFLVEKVEDFAASMAESTRLVPSV